MIKSINETPENQLNNKYLINRPNIFGRLIAVEGNDGVGKTTQIEHLSKSIKERLGVEVFVLKFNASQITHEAISKGKASNYGVYTNTLIHAASLTDQIERIAYPILERGGVVIADRYIYSLIARGVVRGANIKILTEMLSFLPQPELILYFDLDPSKALERRQNRDAREITYWEAGCDCFSYRSIEENFLEFQSQVRKQFLNFKNSPGFHILNADQSIQDLHYCVLNKINNSIKLQHGQGYRMQEVKVKYDNK